MFVRLLPLARAPVECAEAEVAVGNEGAHTSGFGQRQSLAVVGFAALGIEPIGVACDFAEQLQPVGSDAIAKRRILPSATLPRPALPVSEDSVGKTAGDVPIAPGSPAELLRDYRLQRIDADRLVQHERRRRLQKLGIGRAIGIAGHEEQGRSR